MFLNRKSSTNNFMDQHRKIKCTQIKQDQKLVGNCLLYINKVAFKGGEGVCKPQTYLPDPRSRRALSGFMDLEP